MSDHISKLKTILAAGCTLVAALYALPVYAADPASPSGEPAMQKSAMPGGSTMSTQSVKSSPKGQMMDGHKCGSKKSGSLMDKGGMTGGGMMSNDADGKMGK